MRLHVAVIFFQNAVSVYILCFKLESEKKYIFKSTHILAEKPFVRLCRTKPGK